jgi:heme exporter protein D
MQFDSFAEFIAMGGHGLYVWLAYGSTIFVMISSTVVLMLATRRQMSQLRWQVQVDRDAKHRTNRAEPKQSDSVEFSAEKL